MRCAKARKMINDQIDQLLSPEKKKALASHLDSCPECRRLAGDLAAIVEKAKGLSTVEPSPETWARIVQGLRRAGGEKPSLVSKGEARSKIFRPALGLRHALAAAVALVVIGGGVVAGLKWRKGPGAEKDSLAFTLAKLDEAQKYYEKAAASLSQAVESQRGRMDPRLFEAFEQNLQAINATILVCEQIVRSQPENLTARNYLLAAYQNKVNLLDDMIGREMPGPGSPADVDL